MIRQLRTLLVSLFLLTVCSLAFAQNAQIQGQVSDPSGAVIPKALVRIVNQTTGTERKVVTNGSGQYSVSGLDPSLYKIFVQAPGFSTAVSTPITLNVGQNAVLDFKMQVGSEAQSVTVDGSGLTINTTDGSVGTVIDRKFVENMPLNGRSFQDLISMTPGVLTASPQSSGTDQVGVNYSGDFSVNGQRTESNYYLVDGVSANISAGNGTGSGQAGTSGSLAGATALGTTQALVSVDALQEFRVSSSTYSAEYGRTPGGQFSFLTRSGTNSLHGSAFDYLRNNFFDANDWFNDHFGVPIAALRQNDFGGTVGGPIWFPNLYDGKNKSFFFISYEGLRLMQPQAASVQYVPDTNLRQNAPAALQPILNAFPIQTGSEALVPCTSGATSSYPCPTGSPTGTLVPSGLALFTKAYSLPSTIDSTSLRFDHTFGPKLSLFFRFGDTPSSSASRVLSSFRQNQSNSFTYTLGATSQLSNNSTNEFRLGYARANAKALFFLDSFGGAVPVNLAALEGLNITSGTFGAAFEAFVSGVGSSTLSTQNYGNLGRQWNAIDIFNLSSGHHHLKLGVDYRRIKSVLNGGGPDVNAIYESSNAILDNSANLLLPVIGANSTPIFNETSLFIQDEWRAASRLNISIGVRWELDPPPTEEHGHDAYTILGSLSDPSAITLAPLGTPLWKTTYANFAPRLGIAWQAHTNPGWETVFRGGAGVFFDTANESAVNGFRALGYSAAGYYANAPLPFTAAQLDFTPSAAPPYTSDVVYAFPPHLQLPYTLQWNVSMQQELGKAQALTLSYVGANGRRLLTTQSLYLSALNPNFGDVYYLPGNITSSYNALQAEFQRSVSKGLQALASYTWSHSLDFGSNYAALPVTRGNSDFDVRSNFQAGLSWDLPTIKSGRLAQALLNEWGMDMRVLARTAFPITLTGNYESDPATGSQYYTNVNLVPGQPLYVYGSQYPGGRALNPAAYSYPSGSDPGDAPRNFVRAFGESQVNFAVRRTFVLHEGITLQFRAETFNVLNHPNFGYVDPNLTDATFGQAQQMLNQSLLTVASQYQQGGPRSMQFALRLSF